MVAHDDLEQLVVYCTDRDIAINTPKFLNIFSNSTVIAAIFLIIQKIQISAKREDIQNTRLATPQVNFWMSTINSHSIDY